MIHINLAISSLSSRINKVLAKKVPTISSLINRPWIFLEILFSFSSFILIQVSLFLFYLFFSFMMESYVHRNNWDALTVPVILLFFLSFVNFFFFLFPFSFLFSFYSFVLFLLIIVFFVFFGIFILICFLFLSFYLFLFLFYFCFCKKNYALFHHYCLFLFNSCDFYWKYFLQLFLFFFILS